MRAGRAEAVRTIHRLDGLEAFHVLAPLEGDEHGLIFCSGWDSPIDVQLVRAAVLREDKSVARSRASDCERGILRGAEGEE